MAKRTWNLFRGNGGRIASLIAGNILANLPRGAFAGILYLIILQVTVPVLQGGELEFDILWKYYWMYIAAFVLYIVFSIIGSTNSFVQSYKISTNIRLSLGEKLRRLSLGFFKRNDPGDVTSRMLHDVNKAEEILSHHFPDVITAIVIPLMLGTFLCFINVRLTMYLILGVACAMVFFVTGQITIRILSRKHVLAISRASSKILEYASIIKLLKSYDMTGSAFRQLDGAMRYLKKMSFRTEVWAGIPIQIAMFLLDASYLLTLYVATRMHASGSLEISQLFSFAILGYYFFEPVKQLGMMMVMLRFAKSSTDRIAEVFAQDEPEYSKGISVPSEHDIEFDNVNFAYRDSDVLCGVSCNLPRHSMTALVGKSGSGKTTMTSLIARFWDVDSGDITLGGMNIREIEPSLLLKHLSMVFQQVFLFNDTIANNIRVGKQGASDEEVMEAAKKAQCHDFIMKLPQNYQTVVSEGGRTLSGGERQRISIARAILKDAPVVLLDEATASLDPENEYEIQLALNELITNKTLIVIAHKFNTIRNADRIVVIDEGKVTETGRHEELVKQDGLYAHLWELQQEAGSWKMRA